MCIVAEKHFSRSLSERKQELMGSWHKHVPDIYVCNQSIFPFALTKQLKLETSFLESFYSGQLTIFPRVS